MEFKKAIIVDLDGTLANCDHRLHHLQKSPKNWSGFFEELGADKLNLWCSELVKSMKASGYTIILMTGRSDEYKGSTIEWLTRHKIEFDLLIMRAKNDFRSDTVVKRDLYQKEVAPHYRTLFCLEDRQSVVAMWREMGVTCLQCDVGDF